MPTGIDELIDIDETTDVGDDDVDRLWRVILYNDDWHAFDEVVVQVQRATGYSLERAVAITYEAHTQGRAIAYEGSKGKCRKVVAVLREIRLQAEIDEA
jgi:ATP-dependent Clp protease adaptor protein ClpS